MLSDADKLARQGIITGSRIAKVLGCSPYGGPLSLFLEMTGQTVEQDKPQFARGRHLEPGVLSWHAEEAGCVLRPTGTLIHPVCKRIGATPDAIATYPSGEERAVEAKTVDWRKAHEWGEPGSDHIPRHYLCQAIFEAGVTGLRSTDVPALFGLDDFRRYWVRFDSDLFGVMVEHAERFLRDHVDTGIPPEPDGSEEATAWLDKRFAETREKTVRATNEAEELMRKIRAYRQTMKDGEKEEAEAIQKLQELMGAEAADAMAGDGWSITWRRPKGSLKTDFKALVAELEPPADLIEKHTRISEQKRTFRMNWKEGAK